MKNPTKKIKAARDAVHFSLTITDRQAARMKEGRIESRPEDYSHLTPDTDRLDAMRRAEDLKLQREFERATGSSYA